MKISKKVVRVILSLSLVVVSFISSVSMAQVEVITAQIESQYNLDFSPSPVSQPPFTLVLGSRELRQQGYNVKLDALYLRDNNTNSLKLISRTLGGNAAKVKTSDYVVYFDASRDFSKIVFVSSNRWLVRGDTVDSEDVFIYDRTSDQISRVESGSEHTGRIYVVRISPTGEHLAFASSDKTFNGPLTQGFVEVPLYLYDLNHQYLSVIQNEHYTNSFYQYYYSLTSTDNVAFTNDGDKLFYIISGDSDFGGNALELYDLNNQTNESVTFSVYADYDYSGEILVTSLNDTYYQIGATGHINPNLDGFFFQFPYDISQKDFINSPVSSSLTLAGISTNKNFAIFISEDPFQNKSGVISVLNLQTGELKRALTPRKALAFFQDDYVGFYCGQYVFNGAFYQTPVANLHCSPYYSLQSRSEYISKSESSYSLNTQDVRFHDQNRYISFKANNWYLDESIAYSSFSDPNGLGNQFIDDFVVPNPFLIPARMSGAPAINQTRDKGLFIWKQNGNWTARFVSGGQQRNFTGNIISTGPLSITQQVSIESNDRLTTAGQKKIQFKLKVKSPYRDEFSFNTSTSATNCVNLTGPSDFSIYLGPDRVRMPNSVDLDSLQDCDL